MIAFPKPPSCLTCPGYAWRDSGFQPLPETPAPGKWNGVLLVGEALGEAEAASGKPFQGRAGWAFTSLLQRVGLERDNFLIDNSLRCRPPDNKLNGQPYEAEVLAHCGQHLDSTISSWKPKVIVPMGEVAMQRILALPKSEKITPRRGWVEWSYRYNCWVIPTFHPAFLMRGNQHLSGVFLADVGYAVEVAAKGHTWNPNTYVCDPPIPLATQWVEEFEHGAAAKWLACDIETPYKATEDEGDLDFTDNQDDPSYIVLRVGYCWEEGEALSLPFAPEFLSLHARLLRSAATKLWWNARYDLPRLAANGLQPAGPQWDVMWAWHILNSDLPKGLAFVASLLCKGQARWKHLGSREPAKYNAIDAEVTRRIATRVIADLQTHHLLHVFDRHIVQLDQVLADMSAVGITLSQEKRLALSTDVAAELARVKAAIQDVVPLAAKDVFFYKVPPKDTSSLVRLPTEAPVPRCSVCGKEKPSKPHFRVLKKKVNACAGGSVITSVEKVERWALVSPFVPSITRMKAYQAVKGHKPRISKTKERRVTFDEGAIRDLRLAYPDDPLYPLIVEYREYEKILTTYVGRWTGVKWEGGPPTDKAGVVHTLYSHEPSTLRLSSQDPNLHNIPRGSDSVLQRRIKEMFVAREGCWLLEADYKAIEAVLVGYFARDEGYVRLAKLGVHDFLNSHNLKRLGLLAEPASLDWSDIDLKAFFKDLKAKFPETYRNVAKRTVHMSNYGGTPKRMRDTNPELFPLLRDAQMLQGLYFEVCPGVRRWQTETIRKADEEGFLRNPFGYVHRFWAVQTWKKSITGDWEAEWGEDAKRVLAFLPQSTAAGILKEAILRLSDRGVGPHLRLNVHDSLVVEAPRGGVFDWMAALTIQTMEEPLPQMPLPWDPSHNLSIDVEAKVGDAWSPMSDFHL